MADWEALNQNIGSFSSALGEEAKMQRMKQMEMESSIQLAIAKARLEQLMNQQSFKSNIGMMREAGLFGDISNEPQQVPSTPISQQSEQNVPMFLRKPSFQIDPATGKFSMGISEVENPYFRQKMDIDKSRIIENQKPFSADEIKIASGMDLIPQIDKLINLVKSKNVYGEGKIFGNLIPFGASRISAFGEEGWMNNFKRGLTAGNGRKAGLILQDIKQLMFSVGGTALTDPEILKLGPKMEPAYKSEEQWIKDLEDVKMRITNRVRMLRANPDEAFQNTQPGGESNDGGLPAVGSMFNNERVLKIRKVK